MRTPYIHPHSTLAEEHLARLKAEAEAQDCANRLRVAQEQLAEYAAQKESDANALLAEAETLQQLMARALQQPSVTAAELTQVAQQLSSLREKLDEAAVEARAFHAQARADMESLKRSSAQVRPGLPQTGLWSGECRGH